MEWRCEILAKNMLETVYPKMIQTMSHLNMKEVQIEVKNTKKMVFNINGVIKWLNKDGSESCKIDFKKAGNTICPALKMYEDIASYRNHCMAIMDKIIDLEKNIIEIDYVIERTNRIDFTYERKILIEKIKQNEGSLHKRQSRATS